MTETAAGSSRARLVFAAATAAVLLGAVAVVALGGSGSGDDEAVVEAPPECLESWNDDPSALAFGRHNFSAHAYLEVEVTRLARDGTEPVDPGDGLCALIFARTTLDPEPAAAAQLFRGGEWVPLSGQPGIEAERLAELQSDALELANADLETDGSITVP